MCVCLGVSESVWGPPREETVIVRVTVSGRATGAVHLHTMRPFSGAINTVANWSGANDRASETYGAGARACMRVRV